MIIKYSPGCRGYLTADIANCGNLNEFNKSPFMSVSMQRPTSRLLIQPRTRLSAEGKCFFKWALAPVSNNSSFCTYIPANSRFCADTMQTARYLSALHTPRRCQTRGRRADERGRETRVSLCVDIRRSVLAHPRSWRSLLLKPICVSGGTRNWSWCGVLTSEGEDGVTALHRCWQIKGESEKGAGTPREPRTYMNITFQGPQGLRQRERGRTRVGRSTTPTVR